MGESLTEIECWNLVLAPLHKIWMTRYDEENTRTAVSIEN